MNLPTVGQWSILLLHHTFYGQGVNTNHFLFEPGFEEYSFLDQVVADLESGLDSILTDSIEILKLDAYFDEPDVVTFSVSSEFMCLVASNLIKCGSQLGYFFCLYHRQA